MKYALKTIIITVFVGLLSLTPTVFAQTQEELEAEYQVLLMQMIVQLQEQMSQLQGVSTEMILPPENLCGVRYLGVQTIIAVQQELKNQGYTVNKVDGKIGPETRAAVSAFQAFAGALKVDGLIGNETRNLLAQNSIACVGDAGVTVSETPITVSTGICELAYVGTNNTLDVQQGLQDQGYTITKVDGIAGPETTAAVNAFQASASIAVNGLITEEVRTALSRRSLLCDSFLETPTLPPVVIELPDVPTPDPGENTTTAMVQKTNIISSVRSTTDGVPDDTAVFTYLISFTNDGFFFVPSNPSETFYIKILNSSGGNVSANGIDSVVSSAQKILREDGTSYFRVKNGDTMSLRTSVQPGAGNFYAELGRFSYTTEDALTVQNPTMTNYGFNVADWRSETITLLN